MKIKLVVIIALVFSLMACENQEIAKDDFGSTSVFFPFQTPARTLVLGEYDLGFNDNDNNGRFEIGVVMSGVFENKIDRKVYFELAPELIDANILGVDSVNVQILPSSYYTIEQQSPVTIPAGSINGRIPIQLSDAFFDDPLAFAAENQTHYVIPLRITDYEELDSLLTGIPIVPNPIKIKTDDWNPLPKDYTLFGIKFMNKYQGVYLRRGEDKVVGTSEVFTASSGTTVTNDINSTSVYQEEFVERDEVVPVMTTGRNSASVTNRVRRGDIPSTDNVSLNMTFDNNGNISITNVPGDKYTVTGTGRYVEDGDEWGGQKRNVMYLEYQYSDVEVVEQRVFGQLVSRTTVDLLHTVKDTLVIRNRDVKFEEFTVQLITK
ncbi:DUF5627 domain-containing protein [Siansivirga zeaxanthinifaciens]|uniref:DUF1735 domain-containing protein n=1 Tax=Siansivirga zeaxanthinifaciens CC-SAMT-1 TaxID=1454006 RepID=A0A0C5WPV8_9FLAO|nr:DUF5627 domain-containing protein [Siansivirga zeaxanthinifaciens]AJR04980.1 hypothetical protein AW14_13590 [Siansivirga zeaxanthinifaciens CC-SAMT-1]